MEEVKKIRTACRSCHGGCGVIAHVKDGKVIKVEGDPDSPISHGTLCSKGLAITQLAYHPERILHPMKKIDGKMATDHLGRGPEHDCRQIQESDRRIRAGVHRRRPGTGRDYESHLYRFANLLGTPNVLTAGHMCYVSRVASTLITCGNLPIGDYRAEPKCIVMWACNPQWTNPDEYKGVDFWRAYKKGAKLICIDPRKGFVAKRADLWLQLRPGTDAALAMGFHRVIIEEELYDREFVDELYPRLGGLQGEGDQGLSPGTGAGDHLGGQGPHPEGGQACMPRPSRPVSTGACPPSRPTIAPTSPGRPPG